MFGFGIAFSEGALFSFLWIMDFGSREDDVEIAEKDPIGRYFRVCILSSLSQDGGQEN